MLSMPSPPFPPTFWPSFCEAAVSSHVKMLPWAFKFEVLISLIYKRYNFESIYFDGKI